MAMRQRKQHYTTPQQETIDTVALAQVEGVELEHVEKLALWQLASGGLGIADYLGEERVDYP